MAATVDNARNLTLPIPDERRNEDAALCPHALNSDKRSMPGRWRLVVALLLCLLFMVGEVVGGVIAHSLAVLTDAAHMLSDVLAFAISLIAGYYALRKSNAAHTFGYHRAEVLGGAVSVLIIWVVTGILVYEAILRVMNPQDVDGRLMFFLALSGIIVNVVNFFVLSGTHAHSHNGGETAIEDGNGSLAMRSAVIHVAGDCVQSVGVGVAAVIIWLRPAWRIADPISTFVFAALVLFTTWRLVVDLIDIVMERVPRGFDLESLTAAMRCIPAVDDIHDIHIWALKPGGTAGAGENEGEGGAEVVELVEVDVSGGLAVEEGDGLQGDEEEIGGVGTGPGEGIFGPLTEVVDVGAGYEELASLDGVGDGFGVWGEAEADIERGGGCDVFEAGCPSAEDSGGEGAAADGGAGLQAQLGGGPGRSVDHSGDAETRDVLELEEAVYEGVQQSVIVGVEDVDGKESGCVENAVDYVGGGERCPHNVGPVPVLPGVGRFAVAAAVGIPVAVTGLGRARSAPREEGEEGLLFIGGLCDGRRWRASGDERAMGGWARDRQGWHVFDMNDSRRRDEKLIDMDGT
ncbi:g471 [Coccomyxa elongata]